MLDLALMQEEYVFAYASLLLLGPKKELFVNVKEMLGSGKKCLVVVWAVEKRPQYLKGHNF